MLAPLRDRGRQRAGESAEPNFGVYGKLKAYACRKNYPLCSENPTANEEAKRSLSPKRNSVVTKETKSKQVVTEKLPMACSKALKLLSLLEHSGPSEHLYIAPQFRKTVLYSNPGHPKSVQFKEAGDGLKQWPPYSQMSSQPIEITAVSHYIICNNYVDKIYIRYRKKKN